MKSIVNNSSELKIDTGEIHFCLYCNKELKGRSDKKFCSDECRNAWHNDVAKKDEKEIKRIINILKKNRKILRGLHDNATGKKAKKELMMRKGFSFDYVTQVQGSYRFCFEYGYCGTTNPDYYFIVRGFETIVNKE